MAKKDKVKKQIEEGKQPKMTWKEFKKAFKRKFNRDFWIKFLIIASSLVLILTSFLPYLL